MQHTQLWSITDQETSNLLNDFHLTVTHLPTVLRKEICKECNWSIPTYYRKCRTKQQDKRIYDKEEELKIMSVYLQILQAAFDQIEKHKKLLSKTA